MNIRSRFFVNILLGFIPIFLLCVPVNAQLKVVGRTTPVIITATTYPLLTADVRATQNAAQYQLSVSNVLILEDNRVIRPKSVDAPQSGGYQRVTWYSQSDGVTDARIVVLNGSDAASTNANFSTPDFPILRFRDWFNSYVKEESFGIVEPGKDTTIVVGIYAFSSRYDANMNEFPIRVDSVTTETKNFEVEWIGSIISSAKPPVKIYSAFIYEMNVKFKPTENRFYRDVLTVHFDGGGKTSIELIGNSFRIQYPTVLNVVTPNGKDTVTPCQVVPVRWNGATLGSERTISYSTNNGGTWTTAGKTKDSVFEWKVPEVSSSSALVRVTQALQNGTETSIIGASTATYSIAFDAKNTHFVAVYDTGEIGEWEMNAYTRTQTLQIPAFGKIEPIGVQYLPDGSISVAYRQTGAAQVFLAVFKVGATTPDIFPLPTSLPAVREVLFDNQGRFLIAVPKFHGKLSFFNPANGQAIRTLDFPAPVSAVGLTDSQLILSLLGGDIIFLSLSDFSEQKRLRFPGLPIIHRLTVSNDGTLLALGGEATKKSKMQDPEAYIYVAHVPSSQIIRTLHKGSTDPVGLMFSPNNRFLAFGYRNLPQAAVWEMDGASYPTMLGSHPGNLTAIRFSSNGQFLLTCADSPTDNLKIRTFSFPEQDESDTTFFIIPASMKILPATIPPIYLGTTHDTTLTATFCNNGVVPVVFENSSFRQGWYFSAPNIVFPDTVRPGECLSIPLRLSAFDPDTLRDTLNLNTCSRTFGIPLQAFVLRRNIKLLASGYDFGELCLGEMKEQEIDLIRNDDPVPLLVNKVWVENQFDSFFTIMSPVKDTTLKPGEILRVLVRFKPLALETDNRKITIFHSNHKSVTAEFFIKGRGTGAEVAFATDNLRFVPEILTRTVTIANASPNAVEIQQVEFSTTGIFSLITPLPVTIPAGGTAVLEIRWLVPQEKDVELTAILNQCNTRKVLLLGAYSAMSTLSIPKVSGDVRGEATIPVYFENHENYPYRGIRSFETEFTVNPRMFLPQSITSAFGTAEITRNEIIGGKRIIGIKVVGNFGASGIAAEVRGIAGLAETLVSSLEFVPTAKQWGAAVAINALNAGELILTGECGDRRIIQPDATLVVRTIFPNPATETASIEIFTASGGTVAVEIFDNLGQKVAESSLLLNADESATAHIPLGHLTAGMYRVIARQAGNSATATLVVTR